jgi:hypothetical protein
MNTLTIPSAKVYYIVAVQSTTNGLIEFYSQEHVKSSARVDWLNSPSIVEGRYD